MQLKLKLKLFTTCTVCAGLQQIPYAPIAVSGPSQLCHTWNLQVGARPLTTYIQPLQGCSGFLLPPGEGLKRVEGCVQERLGEVRYAEARRVVVRDLVR